MSVIDFIARIDAICRRYEKYDLDDQNGALGSQYDVVEAGIEASLQFLNPQKLEAATTEEDNSVMKAEVQQTKADLLAEVSELQRVALEKVNVLSKEEFEAQNNLIYMVRERIEAISDGIATSASPGGVEIGFTSDKRFSSDYSHQIEDSIGFRQGNETRKMKQFSTVELNYWLKRFVFYFVSCTYVDENLLMQ